MRGKAIIIVGVLAGAVGCGSSSSVDSDVRAVQAYDQCQSYVEAQLKSPGTASFPGITSSDYPSISSDGHGAYEVVGVVDAENSFGGKLRANFDCNATTTDGGTTWSDAGTTVTEQ